MRKRLVYVETIEEFNKVLKSVREYTAVLYMS